MKLGNIIKTINCDDRISDIVTGDRIVKEKPDNAVEIHSCNKITIWQEHKGIKRFFMFKVD